MIRAHYSVLAADWQHLYHLDLGAELHREGTWARVWPLIEAIPPSATFWHLKDVRSEVEEAAAEEERRRAYAPPVKGPRMIRQSESAIDRLLAQAASI